MKPGCRDSAPESHVLLLSDTAPWYRYQPQGEVQARARAPNAAEGGRTGQAGPMHD